MTLVSMTKWHSFECQKTVYISFTSQIGKQYQVYWICIHFPPIFRWSSIDFIQRSGSNLFYHGHKVNFNIFLYAGTLAGWLKWVISIHRWQPGAWMNLKILIFKTIKLKFWFIGEKFQWQKSNFNCSWLLGRFYVI